MADLIIDGVHGRYIPEIFCKRYSAQLERAGLSEAAADVIASYTDDAPQSAIELADYAWDEILDTFRTKNGATLWESSEGLFLVGEEAELRGMF